MSSVAPESQPLVIAIDSDDPLGPPRSNGALTFEAPWQGRAFGLCLTVLEREGLPWSAFRTHLAEAIGREPDAPYYESFAIALDEFVTGLGVVSS